MSEPVKIYSASVCPFAQRSRMVLRVKGVDFEVIEINLGRKPDWFFQVSPYGKVPVLQRGSDRVWESAIINEYLEEVFPEPPLMPRDPGERAIARIWIDFANSNLVPTFYKLLLNQDRQKQQQLRQTLHEHLRFMETEGLGKLSDGGAYWLGDSLSLVDLSLYPWFERWCVLDHYRGLTFPSDCPRLQRWWQNLQQHEAVAATTQSPEFHISTYASYADGSASGITAREMRD